MSKKRETVPKQYWTARVKPFFDRVVRVGIVAFSLFTVSVGCLFFSGKLEDIFYQLCYKEGKVIFRETPILNPLRFAAVHQKNPFAISQEVFKISSKDLAEIREHPLALAEMEFYCASGLPGAGDFDPEKCREDLYRIAANVKFETDRHMYRFKKSPGTFYYSEGYFRMLVLMTVLGQDLGLQYNPNLKPEKNLTLDDLKTHFTKDAKDTFLHGILSGDKMYGVCANMPVLVTTVGRILGYPLRLAQTKVHLFVRWEDEKERFNIEATSRGLNVHPDSYYCDWPFKLTQEELGSGFYIDTIPLDRERLIALDKKAHILMANDREQDAEPIFEEILRSVPNHPYAKDYLGRFSRRAMNNAIDYAEATNPNSRENQLRYQQYLKEEMQLCNQIAASNAITVQNKTQDFNREYNQAFETYLEYAPPDVRKAAEKHRQYRKSQLSAEMNTMNQNYMQFENLARVQAELRLKDFIEARIKEEKNARR